MNRHPLFLVRVLVIALLVVTAAAVVGETLPVPGVAVAKDRKGGNSGNGHGGDKGNGKNDKGGKGTNGEKATKEAEKRADKATKEAEKPGGNGNRGKGNGRKDDDAVIVQAANTTPVAVTPTPAATAAPAAAGTLLIHVGSCGATPVANGDWTTACAVPMPDVRFDLTALDGSFAGWRHRLASDPSGTATLERVPPGRYDLTRTGGGWCHAESDRVDADGKLLIAPGQTTTVWIAVCGG